MGIVHTPQERKRCEHPGIPNSDSVPRGTRYYCDYCHKMYATYSDDYGYTWDRWPMNPNRWAAFIVISISLILVIAVACTG